MQNISDVFIPGKAYFFKLKLDSIKYLPDLRLPSTYAPAHDLPNK